METRSPWRTIWTSPRATVRHIVETNPKRSLWPLAFIYGMPSLFSLFQQIPIALQVGILGMLAIILVLSTFWGYFLIHFWSWAVVLTGKLFKGKGNFSGVRAAFAWSSVPFLANICFWILIAALYSPMFFYGVDVQMALPTGAALLMFLLLIGKVVFWIWSIVLYVQALSEVQNYSILRAIGNVIVSWVFVMILVTALMMILGLFVGGCASYTAFLGGELVNPYEYFQLMR